MTDNNVTAGSESSPLDLLSISQKMPCIYGSPRVAIVLANKGKIIQTCCNHWDCPRCGLIRAKHEYGRIVNGIKILSSTHSIFFYTFTCRGRDLSLHLAQRDYLTWTNRLLSTMRARCKKEGGYWAYAQVTERQKRGHPHSHLLMAWIPSDAQTKTDKKGISYIRSDWFKHAHTKAGLGTQSMITPVVSPEAVAKYIAKYLFKETALTRMPANWHRVRYSQSFPPFQIDDSTPPDDAILLTNDASWRRLEQRDFKFETDDLMIYEYARRRTVAVAYKPTS